VLKRIRNNSGTSGEYTGDSVQNIIGDVFSCGLGYVLGTVFLAFELWWLSIVWALVSEVVCILYMRDSLLMTLTTILVHSDKLRTWQLAKLRLYYCPFSGSSRGARDFVENFLPVFQAQNPQLDVDTQLRRGQHPYWHAQYKNTLIRDVGVRNEDKEGILKHAHILRSCHGRPTSEKVRWRHIQNPEQRSVQGGWRPGLFEKVPEKLQGVFWMSPWVWKVVWPICDPPIHWLLKPQQ